MFDFLKRIFSGSQGESGTDKSNEAQGKTPEVEITDEDRLSGRMEFEYEMGQLKEDRQIRLVGTPEFAFTQLMELSGVEVSKITNVQSYAILQDWNGTSCHPIEDYTAYSIFEDLVQKKPDGKFEPYGLARSVTLYLEYDNPEGDRGIFCAHCGVTGTQNKELHLMNRVAILHKIPAKPQVYTNKIMITFDETDARPWREKLDEIRREADRKLEEKLPLNADEETMTGGCCIAPQLIAMGKAKFEAQAWSDAIYYYLRVFRILHGVIYQETAPEFVFNDFMDVSYKLGACYYHKGLYVKANYYLALASVGSKDPEIAQLIQKCNEHLQLCMKQEQTEVETKMMSRLMFMLHFCFDVTPQEIASLYWLDPIEQQKGLIDNPEEIAKFDIREAMCHRKELVLQLSYRTSSLLFEPDNTYDKSRLQYDNSIILLLSQVEGVITVTAMLPQFRNCDVESYQQNASLEFYLEDIINEEAFEQIRTQGQQKLKAGEELCGEEIYTLGKLKLAHYYHLKGGFAFHHKVWGEALYNEYIAQTLFFSIDDTTDTDDFDAVAWRDVNYNIGFAFTQNKNYIPAIEYLAFVAESEDYSYMSEFFNSLTLERDIRSRVYLDVEYDKVVHEKAYPNLTGEERTQYIAYLKRRRGFVMVDQGHFDKALPYLTSLLDDPLCTEFAKSELEYIRQQYHQ